MSGWHVVVGRLADGRHISLLEGGKPLEAERQRRPANPASLYPTTRWRTYYQYLRGALLARKRLPYVIGRDWNQTHPNLPLTALRVVFVQETQSSIGDAPEQRDYVWYDGPVISADQR